MEAVIGVDPHKHVLSAVALDSRGGVLGQWHGQTSRRGVEALRVWADDHAPGAVWAIEGSTGLGRRLTMALLAAGAEVRDVCASRTGTPAARTEREGMRRGAGRAAP